MSWLILAVLGAVFTSLTSILAKIGLKGINSNFATMYRTVIVILCALILCFISGSIYDVHNLDWKNYLLLILSGIATGLSWLCYFKALQLGDVNKVAPIDKSSFVLTSILFLIFFFDATTKNGDVLTIVMLLLSITLITSGTILMVAKGKAKEEVNKSWLIYAILSAIFASLVSLFVKIGLSGIKSDFGTLVRTIVVLIFSVLIVLGRKDYKNAKDISFRSWILLTLSGVATGGAWLCEYEALNTVNVNPVAVNSISKLAILMTMLFSFLVLKEKFSKKAILGLSLLTAGIILIIIFSL